MDFHSSRTHPWLEDSSQPPSETPWSSRGIALAEPAVAPLIPIAGLPSVRRPGTFGNGIIADQTSTASSGDSNKPCPWRTPSSPVGMARAPAGARCRRLTNRRRRSGRMATRCRLESPTPGGNKGWLAPVSEISERLDASSSRAGTLHCGWRSTRTLKHHINGEMHFSERRISARMRRSHGRQATYRRHPELPAGVTLSVSACQTPRHRPSWGLSGANHGTLPTFLEICRLHGLMDAVPAFSNQSDVGGNQSRASRRGGWRTGRTPSIRRRPR